MTSADWSRRFFDAIKLPDGRKLNTLREAANYIVSLPQHQHDLPHWLIAMEVLLICAEHGAAGGDAMLARIAMLKAINADRDGGLSEKTPAASPTRRKRAKRYKVVR